MSDTQPRPETLQDFIAATAGSQYDTAVNAALDWVLDATERLWNDHYAKVGRSGRSGELIAIGADGMRAEAARAAHQLRKYRAEIGYQPYPPEG